MSCGVVCRRGLDPTLLWLWRRPAAVAPNRPLAWEPPCAKGAALKKTKDQKKNGLCCSWHGLAVWDVVGEKDVDYLDVAVVGDCFYLNKV